MGRKDRANQLVFLTLVSLGGCGQKRSTHADVLTQDRPTATTVRRSRPVITVQSVDPRFDTAAVLFAGIEMQVSGEPFAQSMGRLLNGYDRNLAITDQYQPQSDQPARTDSTGYAAAVESYEYSRQPMNNLAFESSAGISLAFSPTLSGRALTGRDAHDALRALIQRSAIATHAGVRVPAGSAPRGYVTVPAPRDNPLNTLGFGGIWPTSVPFVSFDPTIRPSNNSTRGCTIVGGYGATAGQSATVGDYECGFSSLQLPSRFGQSVRELGPEETGLALWKYGLWIINYLQSFHDSAGHPIESVLAADLPHVGSENNSLIANPSSPPNTPGIFLGSSDIEGFQGALLIASTVAQTEVILQHTLTTDGRTLNPFATLSEVLAYNDQSPPRWMPSRVAVDEIEDTEATFARVTGYRVARNATEPTLSAQLALLGGFATLWPLVDPQNQEIGNAPTCRAYFDGEPFSRENPSQYWLAGLRWALVTLETMYGPDSSVYLPLVQAGSIPVRPLSNDELTQVIVTLRRTRRSISGRLTLYGDATPDALVTRTALDTPAPFRASSVSVRLTRRLLAHAEKLLSERTRPDGTVLDSARVPETTLDGYLVTVRGLLESYLATGQTPYRERARRVWTKLDLLFYSENLQLFLGHTDITDQQAGLWTPARWAHFTSAVRELYRLVASAPGEQLFAERLLSQWTRMSKLVLNGWDDRNRNETIEWPQECINVVNGVPRGGLQLAERALTGELGARGDQPTSDRDHDCVPEIDDVFLPASLAATLRLSLPSAARTGTTARRDL